MRVETTGTTKETIKNEVIDLSKINKRLIEINKELVKINKGLEDKISKDDTSDIDIEALKIKYDKMFKKYDKLIDCYNGVKKDKKKKEKASEIVRAIYIES